MWYRLDGDDVIKVNNAFTNINRKDRHNITILYVRNLIRVRVSTVFLGLDHNHYGGEPLLFETMVFVDECKIDLESDEYLNSGEIQVRYHTVAGARKGHRKIVEHVESELIKKKLGRVNITNKVLSL